MSQLYEATFRWPHPDASDVIVTGSFDSWSRSHHLTKTPTGFFEGTVHIPWGEKISYKYIVNGRWTTTDDQPTELDPLGNLNNVFRAPARPQPAPPSEPAPVPGTESETKGSTLGAVNGFVETAKQAAVCMVEALAPGTTETPAPTPATETPAVESTPKPTPTPAPAPAPAESEPASAPAESEPTPAEPEVVVEITSTAVLPSEPVPVAPEVPVPVLPLSTEPPTDAVTAPLADVSETKPLDTTVVEGSVTADTVVAETPAPVPAPVEVAASEEKPSTHVPVPTNAAPEEKEEKEKLVATNGTAPPAAPTNGTNGTTQKAATLNGKATTPRKMRFPSLSSRHSRTRSSIESGASELGEKEGTDKDANGKDTVTSRFATTQRPKRRTSLFGKLKDAFSHHPKKEASDSSA